MQLTSVRSSVYFHAFDDIEGSVKGAIQGQHTTKLDTLQRAMRHCNATPDQTLLIGDSQYDAIGAQQAGISFLAVTYGFGVKTENDLGLHKVMNAVKKVSCIINLILK